MPRIFGLPLTERASFSLSPPGRSIRYCGNRLPELDFTVQIASFVERPNNIVCNDENYAVSWTKNPKAYHQIFEQVDNLIDRRKDYYGAQRKLYYLLRDSLNKVNNGGANGHVLVKAFLQLAKIFH